MDLGDDAPIRGVMVGECTPKLHETLGGACYHCCEDCNFDLHKCYDCGEYVRHDYTDWTEEPHKCLGDW